MKLGLFTYLTGIATLLGLFLQVKDVFPKHRETRKAVLLVVCGVFLGTFIGALQGTHIVAQVPTSPSQLSSSQLSCWCGASSCFALRSFRTATAGAG